MDTTRAPKGFVDDLAGIRALVALMRGHVERLVSLLPTALRGPTADVPVVVFEREEALRTLEVELEERCFRLLARWHGQGRHLRYVTSVLKVVGDLRHVGVECGKIVRTVLDGSYGPPFEAPPQLVELAFSVDAIMREALEAFVEEDVGAALRIGERAPFVESQATSVQQAYTRMAADDHQARLSRLCRIACGLQRIAAQATRIAESVMFLGRAPRLPAATGGAMTSSHR